MAITADIARGHAERAERRNTVEHPPHYNGHPSGIECITVTRHMNFNIGNAVKYLWRSDLKHADGGVEDLEKAAWYIRDEIARRTAASPAKDAAPKPPADPEREALETFCGGEQWSEEDVRRMKESPGYAFNLAQGRAAVFGRRGRCEHGREVLSYCPDCAAMHARNLTAAHD